MYVCTHIAVAQWNEVDRPYIAIASTVMYFHGTSAHTLQSGYVMGNPGLYHSRARGTTVDHGCSVGLYGGD